MPKPIPPCAKDRFELSSQSRSYLAQRQKDGTTKAVGFISGAGYWYVRIDKSKFLAHRICFYLAHGVDPGDQQVDHIDGDRLNNHPGNLRLASNADNQANQKLRRENSSGYKGVTYKAARGKWVAQITVGKSYKYLGIYETAEEAASAYDRAAAVYFSDYAKTNAQLANGTSNE